MSQFTAPAQKRQNILDVDDKEIIQAVTSAEETEFWGQIKPQHQENMKDKPPSNLPSWVIPLFKQHQKAGGSNLNRLAWDIKSGSVPKVTLKTYDSRFECFDKDDFIKQLQNPEIPRQSLFILHNKAPLLQHTEGSESVKIIMNFLEKANVKQILCQFSTKDVRYKFAYRVSIYLLQLDCFNSFYVFIHESIFEGRPKRLNYIISDYFGSFYESIYYYIDKNLAEYSDCVKYVNRAFVYRYYNHYTVAREEGNIAHPICVLYDSRRS